MASRLTAATLTVTHTESISINGIEYGGTNTLTIASIVEVSKRIVNISTTEQIILAFSDKSAAGEFIEGDVLYIRFTNKDDTNHIALTFVNESADEFGIKLDKGQTFIYNGDLAGGVVDTFDAAATAITPDSFEDLVNVTAKANTAACDMEIFVAVK